MVRPKSKAKPQSGGRKRQRDDFFEEPDEQDEFFVQSGDEEGGGGSDSGEEDETAEEKRLRLGGGQPEGMHAANRGMHAAAGAMCRRRLQPPALQPPAPAAACCCNATDTNPHPLCPAFAAKAYLAQIEAIEAAEHEPGSDDDEAGGGGGGGGGASHGAVADRLRLDALEGMGHLQRKLASRLALPALPAVGDYAGVAAGGGRLLRGHRMSVTAVALTADDTTLYSVSKEGTILQHDVETGARQKFAASAVPGVGQEAATGTVAEWVKKGPRQSGRGALLAAAVSSDGRYLAVGGGDKKVHIWDARSRQYVRVSLRACLLLLHGMLLPVRRAGRASKCWCHHKCWRPCTRLPALPALPAACLLRHRPAPLHSPPHAWPPLSTTPAGLPWAQGCGHLPGFPGGHPRAVQRLPGQGHQAVEPR